MIFKGFDEISSTPCNLAWPTLLGNMMHQLSYPRNKHIQLK